MRQRYIPSDERMRSVFEAHGAQWNLKNSTLLSDTEGLKKAAGKLVHYAQWWTMNYSVNWNLQDQLNENLDRTFRGLSRPQLDHSLVIFTKDAGSCMEDSPVFQIRFFCEIAGDEIIVHDIYKAKDPDPSDWIPFKVILPEATGDHIFSFKEFSRYVVDCSSEKQAELFERERSLVVPQTVFTFRQADGTPSGTYEVVS